MECDSTSEPISRGICQLPPGSSLVSDADEEVFYLYTDLAAKNASATSVANDFRGLGHVDSHKDILAITFELKSPASEVPHPPQKRKKLKTKNKHSQDRVLEIQLCQDKTALRSRKGDTGSVVWKASIELAQFILQQCHSQMQGALLDPSMLANSHVLELGAGTGLLSVVISPLVRHYTVTDIEDLMPLIRKNLTLNLPNWSDSPLDPRYGPNKGSNITAEPLDWLVLHNCSPSTRRSVYSYHPIDLLLIVDCIYHPSLLPALVHTIDYLATPGKTVVLVMVELRAEDVVREFLELWLAAGGRGTWEIWHVNEDLGGSYVVWIGWKTA